MNVLGERLPPQSIEAEQAVLGALMLDPEAAYLVMDFLGVDDFYRQAHRMIYRIVLDLVLAHQAVDILTVVDKLRQNNKLEEVGGATYLASLSTIVPNAANIATHAKLVVEKAVLRSLISAASEIVHKCYEGTTEVAQLLDEAEKLIMEVGGKRQGDGFTSIKEILLKTFDQVEKSSPPL
jgi:replicative DNA helicase